MEYTINKETGGICTLLEFLSHGSEGCSRCPKGGLCDSIVEMSEKNELSNAKKDELSDHERNSKTEEVKV